MMNKQKGFTLIELMVSIVLGLLVTAAAIALFINGQKSTNLQNSLGELQQNANFGLAVVTQDIRHTNLNMKSNQIVNNKIVDSGIIFGTSNLPLSLNGVSANLFTRGAVDIDATTGKSDQLTIQYMPQYITVTEQKTVGGTTTEVTKSVFNGVDCEGNALEFDEPRVIVQRYHIKQDSNTVAGQPPTYNLYCDAGNYKEGDTSISGMSTTTNGQPIMQKIDAFKMRFLVKHPTTKNLRYMTLSEYTGVMGTSIRSDEPKTHYNIYGVEIGLIARSTSALTSESLVNNNRTFSVLDTNLTLNTAQKNGPKYLREVFSQMVAFRNTLGAAE